MLTESNDNLTPDEFTMYAKIATIAACVTILIIGLLVVGCVALIYN